MDSYIIDVYFVNRFIVSVFLEDQSTWTEEITLRTGRRVDIMLINSALWDINRCVFVCFILLSIWPIE